MTLQIRSRIEYLTEIYNILAPLSGSNYFDETSNLTVSFK